VPSAPVLHSDWACLLHVVQMKEMARKLGIVDFEVADLDLTATGAVPFDEFQAWWRMRMMFIHADKSGEGHLTRQEVKELARTLGIQISVRSMDIDGDDCIDFSEFFAWWNMRHKFDKFDKAKKGNLTYEEASELATSLGADVNFAEMDEDGDGLVDFKEFTEWYKMRRCFEKIDISGDGQLDHVEIKRLAYMLNMDLKIEDIDQDGGGEVDFQEFQKWWGGNKTRAQVMSRVAMQMDRDAANAVEEEPGLPAILFVGIALMLTALLLVPVIATIYSQYTIDGLDLIDCEEKKELVANAPGSLLHPACA
jgi:Ca2+-binding EF-hand superfamily protein